MTCKQSSTQVTHMKENIYTSSWWTARKSNTNPS